MENTTMSKTERMVERMLLSLALQDAINAAAIRATPEQQDAMEAMIAELALQFSKPAEA